jgi:hypothetical protein
MAFENQAKLYCWHIAQNFERIKNAVPTLILAQWRNYYGLRPGEPGGPQPQWAKWGPPGSGCRAKTLARASDMSDNVVFWPSEFCKISPQSLENGISETLDSKIFRMSKPWTPRKLVHIRAQLVPLALLLGGAFENFEPGPPWYNVTPLPCYLGYVGFLVFGRIPVDSSHLSLYFDSIKHFEPKLFDFKGFKIVLIPAYGPIHWLRQENVAY